MDRINPEKYILNEQLDTLPCSYLSIKCACKDLSIPLKNENLPYINDIGYCKLQDINKAIKNIFKDIHYTYFKRKDRITLKNFIKNYINNKYIICVLGHFIYFNGENYISYFENDNDKVVAVWKLN